MRVNDEPQIHSHYEDYLPESHPLAYKTVYCGNPRCHKMLHCGNNECMSTWVEWFDRYFCLSCFFDSQKDLSVIEDTEFKALVTEVNVR